MKVGIPSEVKNHEYRVAITPAGVHELSRAGHDVFVQAGAGLGSSERSAARLRPGIMPGNTLVAYVTRNRSRRAARAKTPSVSDGL